MHVERCGLECELIDCHEACQVDLRCNFCRRPKCSFGCCTKAPNFADSGNNRKRLLSLAKFFPLLGLFWPRMETNKKFSNLKLRAESGLLIVYFRPFLNVGNNNYNIKLTLNGKSIVSVVGIWTRGRWRLGADKSTELWQLPYFKSKNLIRKKKTISAPLSLS